METRKQYTFYSSIFEAIERIEDKADKADAYSIVSRYALMGIEPDLDSLPSVVAITFILVKPVLDAGRVKANSGKKGGEILSKAEANDKQTESKPQAKRKQTASKREANDKQTGSEKEKEVEKEIEYEYKDECPIYSAEPETASAPPVITLPLNDGTEYPVYQEQCQEWAGLYPAVDVIQQLRGMRGWLLSNPSKRKTSKGVLRFITGWLSREQDKGGVKSTQKNSSADVKYSGSEWAKSVQESHDWMTEYLAEMEKLEDK